MRSRRIKSLSAILTAVALIAVNLTGCGVHSSGEFDMNDLEGKKIGVVMVKGAVDAILSQKEIQKEYGYDLVKYDSQTDILMALKYHKLDALGMDSASAYYFVRTASQKGDEYKIYDSPFGEQAICFTVKQGSPVREEFNKFTEEFMGSEEYEDIKHRIEESEDHDFEYKKVENVVTTDRVIRVGVFQDKKPYAYINPQTGETEGFVVEILTHFANYLGAKLEMAPGHPMSLSMDMLMGKLDIMGIDCAYANKENFEMSGDFELTEPYFTTPMKFITIKR